MERIVFRLALLLALGGFVGFGTAGLLAAKDARAWQKQTQRQYQHNREMERHCSPDRDSSLCDPRDFAARQKDLETAAESWGMAVDSSEWRLRLAWLIPLCSLAAFYAGRWILVGRLRPLWPLAKTPA